MHERPDLPTDRGGALERALHLLAASLDDLRPGGRSRPAQTHCARQRLAHIWCGSRRLPLAGRARMDEQGVIRVLIGRRLVARSTAAGVRVEPSMGDDVRDALDQAWRRLRDYTLEGDVAGLSAMYTADAVVLDADAPTASGRAEIELAYRRMLASTLLLGLEREQLTLVRAGDLAVDNGTWTAIVRRQGKAQEQIRGRYMLVWRWAGGEWLVLRDVSLPPQP